MNNEKCPIFSFLSAANGDWRNAIYIFCDACSYGRRVRCEGFLLAFDGDGAPVLLRAETVKWIAGQAFESSECVEKLERRAFERLFARWLVWRVDSQEMCALYNLTKRPRCERDG
jgi:hypothetical protein